MTLKKAKSTACVSCANAQQPAHARMNKLCSLALRVAACWLCRTLTSLAYGFCFVFCYYDLLPRCRRFLRRTGKQHPPCSPILTRQKRAGPREVALQVLPKLRTVHFLGRGGGASVGRTRSRKRFSQHSQPSPTRTCTTQRGHWGRSNTAVIAEGGSYRLTSSRTITVSMWFEQVHVHLYSTVSLILGSMHHGSNSSVLCAVQTQPRGLEWRPCNMVERQTSRAGEHLHQLCAAHTPSYFSAVFLWSSIDKYIATADSLQHVSTVTPNCEIPAGIRQMWDQEGHQETGIMLPWPFPKWNLLMREKCLQGGVGESCFLQVRSLSQPVWLQYYCLIALMTARPWAYCST